MKGKAPKEAIHPVDGEILNKIASEILKAPCHLDGGFWGSLVERFQQENFPLPPEGVPERVAKLLAYALLLWTKERGLGGAPIHPPGEEERALWLEKIMGYTKTPLAQREAFGSQEAYAQAAAQAAQAARERAAATPPRQREEAAQQPAGPAAPPEPDQATGEEYPELNRAYKNGYLQKLVRQSLGKKFVNWVVETIQTEVRKALQNPPPQEGGEPREGKEAEDRWADLAGRMARLAEELQGWKTNLDQLEARAEQLEKELAQMGSRLENLEARLEGLEKDEGKEDLAAEVQALRKALRRITSEVVQHLSELQALAFGPSGRPPILPEEVIAFLETHGPREGLDPRKLTSWLRKNG